MKGIGESGGVAHRLEVALLLGSDSPEQHPIAKSRQRATARRDHRPLTESKRQLARHQEVNVQDPAVERRNATLQVGPLK
jgi:hypothetical protein